MSALFAIMIASFQFSYFLDLIISLLNQSLCFFVGNCVNKYIFISWLIAIFLLQPLILIQIKISFYHCSQPTDKMFLLSSRFSWDSSLQYQQPCVSRAYSLVDALVFENSLDSNFHVLPNSLADIFQYNSTKSQLSPSIHTAQYFFL